MAEKFFNRKQLRWPGFEYDGRAIYYVTICTFDRHPIFGKIIEDQMFLSPLGKLVKEELLLIGDRWENVKLFQRVVMPNHIHCLIDTMMIEKKTSLQTIISAFKAGCTRRARKEGLLGPHSEIWQRSFFDRVVRDERELLRYTVYIASNVSTWHQDALNRAAYRSGWENVRKWENDHR